MNFLYRGRLFLQLVLQGTPIHSEMMQWDMIISKYSVYSYVYLGITFSIKYIPHLYQEHLIEEDWQLCF